MNLLNAHPLLTAMAAVCIYVAAVTAIYYWWPGPP